MTKIIYCALSLLLVAGSAPSLAATRKIDRAVVFQNIISNSAGGDATTIMSQLQPQFVLRAFFKYFPPKNFPSWKAQLTKLKAEAKILKQAHSGIILQGGITAAYLNANPRDTWADGTTISDADFQSMSLKDPAGKPVVFPEGNAGFLADITSPLFQKFLIEWCKPQIDAGMTSLFFDEPFNAANYRIKNWGASADTLYPQYAAAFKVIADGVRDYAAAKGITLLIGKNDARLNTYATFYQKYPELVVEDDLIMGTFEDGDFQVSADGSYPVVDDFNSVVQKFRSIMGRSVPIIFFIDWSHALTEFASLRVNDQSTVLGNLNAATNAAGVTFAYPVFGGSVSGPQGFYNYDSTAIGTFSTILGL